MSKLVPKDTDSPVRFKSPLGDDLLVRSIQGNEEMGRLFVFQLELISTNNELSFDNVVGQQVTAILVLENGERHFNGFITEFRYLGFDGVYSRYTATVRPWLWLLTRTSDCRVFQKMTVPDIIKKVFKLNHMVDFKVSLSATYREWEYCVQYNESDFNFISRLMEMEGIYYFFEHKADKHVMVIADDASAHTTYTGFEEIPFNAKAESMGRTLDSLDSWTAIQSIMPARYASKVYDFENPKADLLAKYNPNKKGHVWPIEDPEMFDYPGDYVTRDDGKNYVEIRLQELQCQQERMHALGGCRGLSPGYSFKLKDYPRDDQNKEYLTISVEHEINNNAYFANEGAVGPVYRCKVEVMDKKKLPFRTLRKTPKPRVQGPQTAVVVGPSSEEIHTDEFGRVIVQFHWDRYGNSDENSSCWVRVSQLWAGTKWGGIHIPRIGQEVVVSFLEGDPDSPLITGSVYNANCMPPYSLVANKTQSGIKSRSTMGGGPDNFNEIRMEDKKDEELLYIQAERDEKIYVKKDKTEIVGENEKIDIYGSRDETVHEDETINVKKNREELVEENETLEVQKDRVRTVGANETIAVGKTRSHTVEVDEKIKIGKNQDISVGKQQSIEVTADRKLVVKGNHLIDAKKDETRDVGKKLVITAGTSILLKCGSASISMKKNGDIKIDGKNVILNGSGKIVAKASGSVVIKGSKVLEN
jgi:type VI secretion system secreted protein VgrG